MSNENIRDEDVEKEIWKGKIPLMFSLASNDVTSLESPHPIYEMIQRMSYISILIEKIRMHFEPFVSKFDKGEIWFENLGKPIKWDYPVGVLFDLLTNNVGHSNVSLPWDITVHFLGFPSEKIQKMSSMKEIQWSFMNTLKTGMFLKHGEVKRVMTLATQEEGRMWDSVRNGTYDIFEEIRSESLEMDGEIKRYPIRLCSLNEVGELKARLVCLSIVEAKEMTVLDFKKKFDLEENVFVIQGVVPEDETNMEWLLRVASHPDRFSYIVLKNK